MGSTFSLCLAKEKTFEEKEKDAVLETLKNYL